ncbi:RNA polymerase sigma-70 factor (ECF subfamily) [Streptomyces sp. CG 926]|uniref:RNA polymerase sigma-70 factor n=1 Tax=Streptomyces sp. CG 926 TaxID=1882405 RepID=UPI000D6D217C|nr:RNA polymerase sigma-70 factor [Streptomyces sp. CG 926]PWK71073.1 RNA polymerase sigma-70 factor (ECF subfamily) [Streptomyces sp. CG 926]
MSEHFEEHRRLLFGTAYRMLGSVADAEDIVQDAWLAWHRTDHAAVENPRAYLVRTVTNLSLNRLRSAQVVREAYVGPWLPEPLLTSPDIAEEAELADTVSMAVLVVLETLTPTERAVFMLREVFGYSHTEIAEVVGKSEASVRQSAHRARERVRARRPRFTAEAAEQREIVEKFRQACLGGDLGEVLSVLAPDIVSWADGGGVVTAARRPLHGADHVARWWLGVLAKSEAREGALRPAEINGEPGLLLVHHGATVGAMTFEAADGRITALRVSVNPQKLRGLRPEAP